MFVGMITTPVAAEDVQETEAPAEPEAGVEPEAEPDNSEMSELTGDTVSDDEPEAVEEAMIDETAEPAEEAPAVEEVTMVNPEPVAYNGVTVTVSYLSDAFGGKAVRLVVGDPDETAVSALDAFGNSYKAVDISFVDESGNEVQPVEGKTVSVSLKAEEMTADGDYEAVHVDGEGNVDTLAAITKTTNQVAEQVKVGETTKTVEVPAETETVTVDDYEEETYTEYETQTRTVEHPAETAFRYVIKSKQVDTVVYTIFGRKVIKKTVYYLDKEEYVVREAYTETITEEVPVTKTRMVLVGSHEETRVIKEAYSYDVTEDVYEEVITEDVESSFDAGSFSVYAIVVVDNDGSLDFDETFGDNRLTVKAPAGAFEAGTEMKVEGQDDPEVLKNALKVLDDSAYSFNAVEISFWKDGVEVEPAIPVKVTWTSSDIAAGDKLVHIMDDGNAEVIDGALVKDDTAVFTASGFSTYATTRQDQIDLDATNVIVFNPGTLTPPAKMASGYVADTHPEFEGYTFKNATIVRGGAEDTEDPVIYLGEFIYREYDDDGNQIGTDKTYIYYRTQSTADDSDLIVKLADDEMIRMNYESTPYKVTYQVVYKGTTYIVGQDTLPEELADLVVSGPESVAENTTYDQGVSVSLPRGYSATVRMSNQSGTQSPALGEGSEPNYSCTDGWTVTPEDYPFTIDGKYTISNVTSDLTVTVNVAERTSYRFTAQPAFNTAYFGGTGTARYQNVTPSATYTFNGNTTTFSFTTRNSNNVEWAMDSLNINKQTLLVPFVDSSNRTDSVSTTLQSGTVVTISAQYNTNGNRTYTITVSNCYENITITGGNLHNVIDKPEWVLQERENLSEFDYLGSSWGPLVAGEPMSYSGWDQAGSNSTQRWNAWRNNRINFTPRVIRFKVKEGYVNPQIKYVTPEGTDDYTRVGDVTLASAADNYYHLVTSEPADDGYYYFSLKGNSSTQYMGLLSAKAELARYGVSYDKGTEVTDATMVEFDEGGRYGDGSLQGYNVEDNQYVIVAKSAPVDNSGEYIFMYYTIDGDTSEEHYAPSQKIDLTQISQFAEYDSEKGEYVIPFVAHWEKKADVEYVDVEAQIYLDDVYIESVHTPVPVDSSIYIDIDSDTMVSFMRRYNWQLFYDEVGSDPFVENIQEDAVVKLHIYSKFYVYHSSTGKLELHTTKELEVGTGDERSIGTLDITKATNPGYLYGGYYSDYLGAHSGDASDGENLVKAAADDNNENGTLTTQDINNLHVGNAVEIATVGTVYNPKENADHVGYWEADSAFRTGEMKSSDPNWFSDRIGEYGTDTAVLQTGGQGTEVTVARAGIYYLKEVPNSYLRPSHITTYQRYDKYLRDFILLSTTDDKNYTDAGFVIGGTYQANEFFTDKLTINFGVNYDETVTDGKIEVDVKNASSNNGGYVTAYRLFHLADEANKDYSALIGNTNFKPYWITPDGITVTGAATRRETVKDKNGDAIITVDSTGEISHRDLAAQIKAVKR